MRTWVHTHHVSFSKTNQGMAQGRGWNPNCNFSRILVTVLMRSFFMFTLLTWSTHCTTWSSWWGWHSWSFWTCRPESHNTSDGVPPRPGMWQWASPRSSMDWGPRKLVLEAVPYSFLWGWCTDCCTTPMITTKKLCKMVKCLLLWGHVGSN